MQPDKRLAQLHQWLKETLGVSTYTLEPVSGDASFRRYFRYAAAEKQYIAVDAPPEKENNNAFLNVTHLLEAEGLSVPHIYYSSLDFGFFLLEDFGNTLFLNTLNNDNADNLYNLAFQALSTIQKTMADSLPRYDEKLLFSEMELFRKWFLHEHLEITLHQSDNKLFDDVFKNLANNACNQPQVFVHRDYHSRNLMQINAERIGIIDYQDAVLGPITYDVVSLLRDCYIAWPQKQVESWALMYLDRIIEMDIAGDINSQTFLKWFDLMGIQRHLKAIGIFARLNHRDRKPNYLDDIPRTLKYISTIAPKYPETAALAKFIQEKIT